MSREFSLIVIHCSATPDGVPLFEDRIHFRWLDQHLGGKSLEAITLTQRAEANASRTPSRSGATSRSTANAFR